jgi:hypothetical protein
MAFGDLKTVFVGNGNSVTASNIMSGTATVAVGDLIFAVFGEQTGLTASGVTDNLGNTYTAQNAGTLSSTVVSGRAFWSRVTNPGALTSVTIAATASAHDYAGLVAVIEGPFIVSPNDTSPANITTDITTPFACPATGTLAQATESVLSWMVANQSTVITAVGPNISAGNIANSTNVIVTIGYQTVGATTTVTPNFASAANPTNDVLGTMSFKGNPKPAVQPIWGSTWNIQFIPGRSDPMIWNWTIPFNQQNWPDTNPIRFTSPPVVRYNQNLYSAVAAQAPFKQVYWPDTTPVRYSTALSDAGIWNLVVPFNQNYWPDVVPVKLAAPFTQPYNINIFSPSIVPAPFVPIVWSAPFFPEPAPVPRIPRNLNLFTIGPVAVPFSQTSWSPVNAIKGNSSRSDAGIMEFIGPFSQTNWPKPYVRPYTLVPQSAGAIIDVTQPFAQYDWSKPFFAEPAAPFIVTRNLNLYGIAAPIIPPFAQRDWPQTYVRKYLPGQVYGALMDVSVPFAQYDWSKPSAFKSVPAGPQPLNLNLYSAVTAPPFRQTNWATSQFAEIVVRPAPQSLNLCLYGPFIKPFNQTDWAPASRIRASVPRYSYTADNLLLRAANLSRVKVWNGSAWVLKPTKVWSGSAWNIQEINVWTGSRWV